MDNYTQQRLRMVDSQLVSRGIRDQRVLAVMRKVPRHRFVAKDLADQAYDDNPLPIGERQTISQPYMVAIMTEALKLEGAEKVLEVGTGSGYQTAILAELAARVISIERVASLATRARRILEVLGYTNVAVHIGDGTCGREEEAPFDAVIVTAGAPHIPQPLIDQLAVGGRLVIPVGDRALQGLIRLTKLSEKKDDLRTEHLGGCRFVSLIGEHGWKESKTIC